MGLQKSTCQGIRYKLKIFQILHELIILCYIIIKSINLYLSHKKWRVGTHGSEGTGQRSHAIPAAASFPKHPLLELRRNTMYRMLCIHSRSTLVVTHLNKFEQRSLRVRIFGFFNAQQASRERERKRTARSSQHLSRDFYRWSFNYTHFCPPC